MKRFACCLLWATLLCPSGRGDVRAAAPQPAGIDAVLPSEKPSGDPKDDRIPVSYYPAVGSESRPSPCVVILHPLGERYTRLWRQFAKYLARDGIGAAVMVLPYHMQRRPRGVKPGAPFIEDDLEKTVQAYDQAASDVSTTITWLSKQPTVDPARMGVVGISLGGIVAHEAMGRDPRLTAGVAMLGGGDLWDMRHRSILFLFKSRHPWEDRAAQAQAMLRTVDPLYSAGNNEPRHVLMIQGTRDDIILPKDARELWRALGRPPIQWMDVNHYVLSFVVQQAFRTTAAYLGSQWDLRPADAPIPEVHPPTITFGFVSGLDEAVTPALEYQAVKLGHRDGMSIAHLGLGWSGRGPFATVGLTVNRYIDVGAGRRLLGHRTRPYVSLHIAF